MTARLTRSRAALLLAPAALSLLALSQWPDNFLTKTLAQLRNFQTEGANLRARTLAYGGLAPALFIIIQVAQVVVAPIPGEASGFLGGYLFGAWSGFLLIAGVGRMPGTLMLSLQGAEVFAGNWLRLAVICLVSLPVVLPCLLGRHRLLERFSRHRAERSRQEKPDHA